LGVLVLIPIGKPTPQQLQEIILKYKGYKRQEVLLGSQLGADAAIIDFGGKLAVVSTDPVTGATDRAGWIAVHIAANDVFCSGSEPVACLLTILAPPGTSEEDLEKIMIDASEAAEELRIEICGGHTEVTDAVNKTIISTVVFGKMSGNALLTLSEIENRDAIVVSKHTGLEGSGILATDYSSQLAEFMAAEEIDTLSSLLDSISIAAESRIALNHGVKAMHDVTEGGILGALYEMAEAAGLGFIVDAGSIPVHPLTQKLCQGLDIDPLRLISSGSLIMVTSDGMALVDDLRSNGIEAAVVGFFSNLPDRIVQHVNPVSGVREDVTVDPPRGDALWEVITRMNEQRV